MSDLEYKCSICGEIHEDYPALAFSSPDYYNWLSEDEKKSYNAQLESDFCTIEYPDGISRFIRVILKQAIIDSELTLDYGLWVSLSENSYNDYLSNYDNENFDDSTGYSYIDSYTRSDGTTVSGHYRTDADEYEENNFSYEGEESERLSQKVCNCL